MTRQDRTERAGQGTEQNAGQNRKQFRRHEATADRAEVRRAYGDKGQHRGQDKTEERTRNVT